MIIFLLVSESTISCKRLFASKKVFHKYEFIARAFENISGKI